MPEETNEHIQKRIQKRTIDRFETCQAARKKAALGAGAPHEEAHAAAKTVWNAWAEKMLQEKQTLKARGDWATEEGRTVFGDYGETGANAPTRDWLERAASDFSSLRLVAGLKGGQPEGDSSRENPDAVKTLFCEAAIIDFSGFIFPGDAWFDSATFEGDARFHSATFEGVAWFDSATFKGVAGFPSATFKGDAHFHSATFEGVARFHSATFKGDAHFHSATFEGVARFHSATFEGVAGFHSATFEGDAGFDQVTFAGNTRFADAEFGSKAFFSAIHVTRAFDMAGAGFHRCVPDFIQAHFTEAPRLDNVTVRATRPLTDRAKPDKNDPARYRALTRLAVQAHDHDREIAFFRGQKRAELMLVEGSWWSRFFSLLYGLVSDYGRSLMRPFLGLIAANGVFALIYWSNAAPASGCADGAGAQAFFLSLVNALPTVGSSQRQNIINAYECLYGSQAPVLIGTLGIFQTFISIIFLFLIALALRNMFRIK